MSFSSENMAAALMGAPWGGPRPSLLPRNPRSAGTLRAALIVALQRLAAGQGVDCALSGGVDSALLVSLLRDRAPRAWTLADEGMDDPEVLRARQMADSLGVEHRIVALSQGELWDCFSDAVRACGVLIYNGRAVAKHVFYRRLAEQGVTSLVSGLGADEVLLGDPLRLLQGDPFRRDRALAHSWLLPSLQGIETPGFRRTLHLDEARAWALSQGLPNDGLPPERSSGAAAGIDVVLPYLTPEVISWGLQTPVDHLVVGSMGKMVLRTLALDLVPDDIRLAPKQPRLQAVGSWAAVLSELLSAERLRALALVDPARVESALGRYRQQPTSRDAAVLERVLLRLASLSVLVLEP